MYLLLVVVVVVVVVVGGGGCGVVVDGKSPEGNKQPLTRVVVLATNNIFGLIFAFYNKLEKLSNG